MRYQAGVMDIGASTCVPSQAFPYALQNGILRNLMFVKRLTYLVFVLAGLAAVIWISDGFRVLIRLPKRKYNQTTAQERTDPRSGASDQSGRPTIPILDAAHGYGYFIRSSLDTLAHPSRLVKVQLSDFKQVADVALPPANHGFIDPSGQNLILPSDDLAFADQDPRYGYFLHTGRSNTLEKVRLADYSVETELTLPAVSGRGFPAWYALPDHSGHVYLVTSEGKVLKVRLPEMEIEKVEIVQLISILRRLVLRWVSFIEHRPPPETVVSTAVLDAQSGIIYLNMSYVNYVIGDWTFHGIVKLHLPELSRLGTVFLDEPLGKWGLVDPASHQIVFDRGDGLQAVKFDAALQPLGSCDIPCWSAPPAIDKGIGYFACRDSLETIRFSDCTFLASIKLSPTPLTLLGRVFEYRKLEKQGKWKEILSTFAKDQPQLIKPDPDTKRTFLQAAPLVAKAYQETGNRKKAAYYYGVAAELSARIMGPDVTFTKQYLKEGLQLDPSSQFLAKIREYVRIN